MYWNAWGVVGAAGLMLAGCGGLGVGSPEYEGSIACKGKVGLTITGNLQIGAGYGGGGSNAASVVGDCGEGFYLERKRKSGDSVVPPMADQPGPIDPEALVNPFPQKTP